MNTAIAHQLPALQRIAEFSAGVRGHHLGAWHKGVGFALASCVQCGAELTVYFPARQPEMHGLALDHLCGERSASEPAA
jgi:hypothetical protein